MRKRNVQILFRLTEEEAEYLYDLVRRSGRSKEALLRSMVKGYRLCEKPDPEFYKILRELSAIGNRINQLAAKANALPLCLWMTLKCLRSMTAGSRPFSLKRA